MLTRRTFAAATACGLAGAELPRLVLITGAPLAPVPGRLAAEACVFSRAYTACPDPSRSLAALLSGRFPHTRGARPLLAPSSSAAPDSGLPWLYISGSSEDQPYERATHLALALHHPRLPRGKMFDFPVSTVDIALTLLALEGAALPPDLPGRDLSPLLLSGKGDRPESIFAEGGLDTGEPWRMVVRGLDKIVVRPNLDLLHLFNLGEDPGEEHDLAQEVGYRLKVDELRALVYIWMKRTGDGMDPSGLKRR